LISRLANALVSYIAYLGDMLWPTRLAAFYPYRSVPAWQSVASMVVLVGVTAAVIRAARRYPYVFVGWLWYLGTLLPVIGLIQAGEQARADRFTYVPLIGIFIILAWGIPELVVGRSGCYVLPAVASVVIVACAVISMNQVQCWRNSHTLWTHAVAVTTGNYQAHRKLGDAFADEGKLDAAIAEYNEALRIRPLLDAAHYNLANALARQGKLDQAIARYLEAVHVNPGSAEAHNGLGAVLADQGKLNEAIPHYSEALRINPDLAPAHNNLGTALADQGNIDEAIHEFLESLRIRPDTNAHYNLGVMLSRQGKADEAARHFRAAVQLDPKNENARRALDTMPVRAMEPAPGTR
jgi:protein O-mannosyl-transferase